MSKDSTYKAMYKSELAQEAGVSLGCITQLCKQYEAELKALFPAYKRTTKLLPPILVNFLKEKYFIS